MHGVYKKNKLIAVEKTKRNAKIEALKLSNIRWTYQTQNRDFKYLEADGYKICKVKIVKL